MTEAEAAVRAKMYVEYHLTCEQRTSENTRCSRGLVADTVERLAEAVDENEWEFRDGKFYCDKHRRK